MTAAPAGEVEGDMPKSGSSIDDDIARAILASRFDDGDGHELARLIASEIGRDEALAEAAAFERAGVQVARICRVAAEAFRTAVAGG